MNLKEPKLLKNFFKSYQDERGLLNPIIFERLFEIEDLSHIPILNDIIKNNIKALKKSNKELVLRQIIRETINEMVKDIIKNTRKNINKNKIKTIGDIYNFKRKIVVFSSEVNIFDILIKEFLKEKMYYSKGVLRKTNEGKKIINFLFLKIKKNPKKFIKNKPLKIINLERTICDFIAGMTDRYAINLYKSIQ